MIVLFVPIFNAGLSVSLSQAPPCMASLSLPPAWRCYFLFLNPISPLFLFLSFPSTWIFLHIILLCSFLLLLLGCPFPFLEPPNLSLHYYPLVKNSWLWYLINSLPSNIRKNKREKEKFLCVIIFVDNSFVSCWWFRRHEFHHRPIRRGCFRVNVHHCSSIK